MKQRAILKAFVCRARRRIRRIAQIFDFSAEYSGQIPISSRDNRTSNISSVCANLNYLWWIPKRITSRISHFATLETRAWKLLRCSLQEFLPGISHLCNSLAILQVIHTNFSLRKVQTYLSFYELLENSFLFRDRPPFLNRISFTWEDL